MISLKDQDIVCISTSDWNYPFGSRQQIMQRLSKYNRVLFVESQFSILHGFKYPSLFLRKLKGSFRKMQGEGDIYIYSPPPIFLPFDSYFMSVNNINQKILSLLLKWVIKRLKLNPSILWIFHPRNGSLFKVFGERLSVYHCIDEYASEKEGEMRRRVLIDLEKEIINKADIVFTCTEALYKAKRYLYKNDYPYERPNIYLLRGGVEMEKFKVPFPGKEEMPLDVEMIKPPRIGFIGTIDRRIDINLIFNTASQKPGWSIILIGANRLTRKANKHLKRLSNIYFLGIKSHKEIPYYIMAMDVCIIPYLVNEFTRFIFPLKFLEYLAAGKPVVSSFLPELTNFGDFVMISRDWKEFINNIELSISAGSNDFDKRREFVGFFSWKSKVEIISQIIMKELRYK